jgi:hypothetical protein
MAYKKFFGLTWQGPFKKSSQNKGFIDMSYDELVHLLTSINNDEHILIVIEIVGKMSNKLTSLGWTAFRPFAKNKNESISNSLRLPLYHGTLRSLLFIEEPFESNFLILF